MVDHGAGRDAAESLDKLAERIAALFVQAFGDHPGARLAHAKGIVCRGTFEPSPHGGKLSRAAHLRGGVIPVIVRFSDGSGIPDIPDGDPGGNPKGMAVRFELPGGSFTDIVANGLNGFVAGTPADFVDFFAAVVASPPGSASPTPLDRFLTDHPATAAALAQPNPTPASFATQAYYSNNAFLFADERDVRRAVRYQLIPLAGEHHLADEDAAKMSADFLFDELRTRFAAGSVDFRLQIQLAEPGDPTHDATAVWPADRTLVDLGRIRLTSIDPHSDRTQRKLDMDPTYIIDGIALSDDPLPAFRSKVYGLSIAHRTAKHG